MRKIVAILLAVVALAGCKQTDAEQMAVDRAHRRAHLRDASTRSAAYADSVTSTGSRAEKVMAVMAAEGITVGDVATFVYAYGWTLVPSPLPFAHWAPAAPGSAEISHYLFEFTGAVGDTLLQVYAPGTAGAVALRVRAVDLNGAMGPWSEAGLSRGKALMGVGE